MSTISTPTATQNSERSISIIWNVEDVQEVAPNLTDEQAYEVLLLCKKNHDANYGITWETLEAHAEILYPGSTVQIEATEE